MHTLPPGTRFFPQCTTAPFSRIVYTESYQTCKHEGIIGRAGTTFTWTPYLESKQQRWPVTANLYTAWSSTCTPQIYTIHWASSWSHLPYTSVHPYIPTSTTPPTSPWENRKKPGWRRVNGFGQARKHLLFVEIQYTHSRSWPVTGLQIDFFFHFNTKLYILF